MKLLILLSCFLCGCASTQLYNNGQLVANIQGDCTNVTIQCPGLYFHADVLNHSTPTAAAYTGITGVVGAVGTGVVSGLMVH